jgi:uncharacterized protein YutE (UPF0331/DUF86 family)
VTPEAQLWESNALRELKRVSAERGLEFHAHPSRELVPEFLAGYEPDAIIKKPEGGGIVVEVKRTRTGSPDRPLSEIAKRVAAQKGWEFRVIYANPATELPNELTEPTPEQIAARLDEVEVLAEIGHRAPALMLGWAVLEALARLASAHDGSKHSGPLTPLQTVQTLAEEGYLESDTAGVLRQMARVRNAVAHGDLATDVPRELVEDFLAQLRAVLAAVGRVEREPEYKV